ncbi:hypothetical protein ANO14919_079080 [Xylariales sp. No.14919]|nr:hypothetical protein ANO14919_079080 [Xylariales sp. No.14919]
MKAWGCRHTCGTEHPEPALNVAVSPAAAYDYGDEEDGLRNEYTE